MAIERPLPIDLAAERAVLGSILVAPDLAGVLADAVRPDDFFRDAHGTLYGAALRLYADGTPPSSIPLAAACPTGIDDRGTDVFLAGLVAETPTHVYAEHYARRVADLAARRRLAAAARVAYQAALDTEDAAAAHRTALEAFFALETRGRRSQPEALDDLAPAYFDAVDARLQNGERGVGYLSGFADLDALTAGFQPGHLILVAGRPGSGKTSWLLNALLHGAKAQEKRALLFSLEMGKDELVHRLLCAQGGVDSHRVRGGFLTSEELRELACAVGELAGARLLIDDAAVLTLAELAATARRMKALGGLDAIAVDYLQLLAPSTGSKGRRENRATEVAELSRGLKALARDLGVPVLAACQLNRLTEGTADHRPQLSHLRESGGLEQDADLVLMLYREELYVRDTPKRGVAELIVAKNRHGPTPVIPLRFDAARTQFLDMPPEGVREPWR